MTVRNCLVCFFCMITSLLWAQQPKDFVLPVKVTVAGETNQIQLSWPQQTQAVQIQVKRKTVHLQSYSDTFQVLATIVNPAAATSTGYTDFQTTPGILYEYSVDVTLTGTNPNTKSNYVFGGLQVPAFDRPGSILLLIDSNFIQTLQPEINRLQTDLESEGWNVHRMYASRSTDPLVVKQVRSRIREQWLNDPAIWQVFIIGHVPVPYSGGIYPDGHSNHLGAWPDDAYYGDLNGIYTDTGTVQNSSPARPEILNNPGDGKMDQSLFQNVQLAVGRVDFYNLPVFGMSELDLLRRYLNKNHAYRNGQISIPVRAFIDDNFASYSEAFSQGAWKSFAPVVGYDSIQIGQYETDLITGSGSLYSYGCGPGAFFSAQGIVTSSDFVTQQHKTVFTQLFGSYFGDWDSQNNLMRAALASSGSILTCAWGGRPHWFMHHMGLGYPIGYSLLLTQNNKGAYKNIGYGRNMVHIALMGDPSLRQDHPESPQSFQKTVSGRTIVLSWNHSGGATTTYDIYRMDPASRQMIRLTNQPVADSVYIDTLPYFGKNIYEVRGVIRRDLLQAGLFSNNTRITSETQGVIDSVNFYNVVLPVAFHDLKASAADCDVRISWITEDVEAVRLFRIWGSRNGRDFFEIMNLKPSAISACQLQLSQTKRLGAQYFRISAVNQSNSEVFSAIQQVRFKNCDRFHVQLAPNPVNQVLQVQVSSDLNVQHVNARIIAADGRCLKQYSLLKGSNRINVNSIPSGYYTLMVQQEGNQQYLRFVKK